MMLEIGNCQQINIYIKKLNISYDIMFLENLRGKCKEKKNKRKEKKIELKLLFIYFSNSF